MADAKLMRLKPAPLTQDAFAPFGDVISADAARERLAINQGYTTRFHDLATIDVAAAGGEICISIFRSAPLARPIRVDLMERHPLASQAFIPLDRSPYMIVVAPPGAFVRDDMRVFLASGEQGVNYHKGVWHHFLLALDRESDFLVIDRAGPGGNCDEVTVPEMDHVLIDY